MSAHKVVLTAVEKKLVTLQKKPERNKFAIVFLQVRTQYKHHQTYFCGILGITQGTLSKIESGIMKPDVLTYLRFSRRYQVEVI